MKKKIFLCSPLRGDFERNRHIAELLCRIVALKGHIPIAPHVYFTRFLEDDNEFERDFGINAGMELLKLCDEIWVFNFDKISEGMRLEISYAYNQNIPIKQFSDLTLEIERE